MKERLNRNAEDHVYPYPAGHDQRPSSFVNHPGPVCIDETKRRFFQSKHNFGLFFRFQADTLKVDQSFDRNLCLWGKRVERGRKKGIERQMGSCVCVCIMTSSKHLTHVNMPHGPPPLSQTEHGIQQKQAQKPRHEAALKSSVLQCKHCIYILWSIYII